MDVYVLSIKKGCCSVCVETEILGVFAKISLVNRYIRLRTKYGLIAQFTGHFADIELEDADHGLVVLSVTKTNFFGE